MPRQNAIRRIPGKLQKRGAIPLAVSRQVMPGTVSRSVFIKSKPLKAALSFMAILSIVSLGAASAFVIVQKNHYGEQKTDLAIQKDPAETGDSLLRRSPAWSAPDTQKDPLLEYADLKHELTSVDDYAKKPAVISENGDKRPRTNLSRNSIRHNPVVSAVEPQFGVLKLMVEPAGSNILINGKIVASAELAGGKWLKPGTYAIAVFSSGYKGYNSIMRIEANATQSASISLQRLEKGTGLLHVHSYPWADIYIDDALEGTSPTPIPLTLVEGDHVVVLKRDGYKPYSGTVHVVQGETVHLKIELEPAAGAATVQTVKSE
jgi:hypothetical protein